MAELHTKKSAGSIPMYQGPRSASTTTNTMAAFVSRSTIRKASDCKAYQLEDRLGDMMLELYAAAEGLKQQRLAREEAERKRQEDARREEERQNIPDIGGKRRPDSCK